MSDRKYRTFLPSNHRDDDIFLVSFPRSGNTWLSFLIAHAIKIYCRSDREINFFTVREVVPDIHHSRDLDALGPFGREDLPRIIKSHASYNRYYNRVILLVRDPRDVLPSYYRYLSTRGAFASDMSLSEMIRDAHYGVSAWIRHTESWYCTSLWHGQIVSLFRYEDFIKDAVTELGRLTNLLGIPLDEPDIRLAVELSSKDRMKSSEENHRSTAFKNFDRRPFVGKATSTGGKTLTDEDKAYIESSTKHVASIVGYDF